MIELGDGFKLQAEKFNFERDCFDTLAKMKAFPEAGVPDQFTTFCLETKKAYRIDKSNNVDSITGKWREVEYVNIEIGSLKKLPYGSVPTVTNTGIGTTPILNFGIPEGAPGPRGPMGSDGSTWKPSVNQYGYLSWSLDSSTSAPEEYLVKGPQGTPGRDGSSGKDGADGIDGLSAYEIAVKNGFVGTEEEWLASLKGDPGTCGDGTPGTGEGLTEAQKTFLGASGDLQTEAKNSLPSAINEVAGDVQKVWNEVGMCYKEKLISDYTHTVADSDKLIATEYDSNTGIFTTTNMPSWVNRDITKNVFCSIIYTSNTIVKAPFIGNGMYNVVFVDDTHFKLLGYTASNVLDFDTFYLVESPIYQYVLPANIRKLRVIATRANGTHIIPCLYPLCIKLVAKGYDLGSMNLYSANIIGYVKYCAINGSLEFIVDINQVDKNYKIEAYKSSIAYRNNATNDVAVTMVSPTYDSNWVTPWGPWESQSLSFSGVLKEGTNIKIYEIYEDNL